MSFCIYQILQINSIHKSMIKDDWIMTESAATQTWHSGFTSGTPKSIWSQKPPSADSFSGLNYPHRQTKGVTNKTAIELILISSCLLIVIFSFLIFHVSILSNVLFQEAPTWKQRVGLKKLTPTPSSREKLNQTQSSFWKNLLLCLFPSKKPGSVKYIS